MTANSQAIQQYVRIALYTIFGALANYGLTVSDSKQAAIASMAGLLATLAWTIYGTRLNGLLEFAKQKAGVQAVEVKVDTTIIAPAAITDNTSSGITAKAA
jgi:hypothetical protein